MSRLTNERQVEANATLDNDGVKGAIDPTKWTKVLKYSTHGLLTDGYDARGVNTHFTYDGLNRVQAVTFSDDTPKVMYTYDQTRSGFYNNGALTRVATTPNDANPRVDTPDTATEFDYDKMGRVAAHRQSIGTQTYALGYGYNLAGQLTSETYPSGKMVTTGYDAGGRLASIADASRTYANNFQYQTNGGILSAFNLGNGTTQSFGFNDRLQMTSQNLSKGSEVLQKYDYGYGQIDENGNLDVTKNNGQLGRVESYIGTAKQWTQKFSYDSLGRLSEAKEYRGDTNALSYKQKFDFDRFGNLYRKNSSNLTAGQENPLPYSLIEDADISKSTNRFASNTVYDDAGNVTTDNKFRDLNYSYDANGRMFKTSNIQNTNQSNAVYDASGQRVATQVGGVWTFFIYDAFGKMVAEYGGLPAKDEGGVKYVFQDWQGSTRLITGESGVVKARMDYTAFGEEINANVGQRTTLQGFNASNSLNQKYALTERDKATGLDHTWFRKLENKAGRWTSPDPYNGSMSLGNPQSFNRYSYVGNDPTNFVDPSGLNAANSMPSWWTTERWGAEWSGSDHFSWLSDGIVFYGGDFGGLLGGGSMLPGIHTTGYWSEGRWVMTGFIVVHSQSSSGGSSGGNAGQNKYLSSCVQNAVMKYYEFVGNSSPERLVQVQKALNSLVYSTNGFPYLSPPGLGGENSGKFIARAYTEGSHIYFRDSSEYDPKTAAGMAMIVHEFTHIMQYREVLAFELKYAEQYAERGVTRNNVYERRAFVNEDKSTIFFNNNPNLLCP